MFIFGGLPALLIGFIRHGVRESAKWHERFGKDVRARPKMRESFAAIFSPTYRRRTLVMSGLFLTSIIGLWAGSIYVPTAVTQVATRAGSSAADAARLASCGGMVLSIGTIMGCIAAPFIAERLGRRRAMAIFFATLGSALSSRSATCSTCRHRRSTGCSSASCSWGSAARTSRCTLWLPEQCDTACRASAIAFISSIGRFVGVAMVFILADGIRSCGSLGVPVAVTALAFVFGLLILPLSDETRGKALPA